MIVIVIADVSTEGHSYWIDWLQYWFLSVPNILKVFVGSPGHSELGGKL
jgi:hypothetical protein